MLTTKIPMRPSRGIPIALLLAVAIVITSAATPACGDDDAPPQDAGLAENEALPATAAFVDEICKVYEPCCKDAPASVGKCVSDTTPLVRLKTFDEARAKTCLEQVRAESKNGSFCFQAPLPVTCNAIFKHVKALAAGEGCSKHSDCANGDDGDGLCIDNICRNLKPGKEGDACIGTRALGKLQKVPKPSPSAGGASALCLASDGLHCDWDTSTCKKRSDVGGPCVGSDLSCVDAAWCPTTTKQCAERTAVSASCTESDECALGSQCANDGEGGGTCTAYLAEGGACERGDECDPNGLVCDTDTTKCIKDVSVYGAACTASLALVLLFE